MLHISHSALKPYLMFNGDDVSDFDKLHQWRSPRNPSQTIYPLFLYKKKGRNHTQCNGLRVHILHIMIFLLHNFTAMLLEVFLSYTTFISHKSRHTLRLTHMLFSSVITLIKPLMQVLTSFVGGSISCIVVNVRGLLS